MLVAHSEPRSLDKHDMSHPPKSAAVPGLKPSLMVLADGRCLAYAQYGLDTGRPLVVLHGLPGGRTQARMMDAAARQAGVRVIAPDRPGFGYSDPAPNLGFMDYAADLGQLLDHLSIPRATVAGISGGGAFALACAYRLPGRVSQCILIAGMAPTPTPWRKGLSLQGRLLFFLAARWPWLAAALMRRAYSGDPDRPALRRTIAQLPAPDRRILERADVRDLFFGEAAQDNLRQGVASAIHELALFTRPLGFSLRDITVPVHLIHGQVDANVPLVVAEHLASQIPSARLEVIADAAHLFIVEAPELLLKRV